MTDNGKRNEVNTVLVNGGSKRHARSAQLWRVKSEVRGHVESTAST